ncbi:amidase [Zwartia sp.]|uniref:amidase n=1 Tax=Zwartia sp. TaxID=2978004 RepID=UPI002722647C|nr:amidase [Zwartia sp.]MDO9025933.1 amidase [Zwartia sp.]
MTWTNPKLISFAQKRQNFLSGQSTPRDLLEECAANIAALEPTVQAFVSIDLEAARRAADASTARYRAGKPLSLVDGCPVGVKDIITNSDFPTQMGSPAYAGYQTPHDAACVYALRSAGAIIVGKTVTTEFAIGSSRQTTNPFDVTRTPGGSSSGSAAAVGAGMLPVALATQTQASTLRPASYCGAYAFKPTYGAFRMDGVHIMSPTSDHVGVIGASVQDVWETASRIALSVGGSGYPFMQRAGEPIVAAKPGRLIRLFTRGWSEMEAAAQEAFDEMVRHLSKADISIVDRHTHKEIERLEQTLESCLDRALELVVYEMQWPFQDYIDRYGDKIGPRIHRMVEQARSMSRADYADLLQMRRDVQRQLTIVANELEADGFLLPSSSGPAPVGLEYTGSRTFPSFANLAGFPAVGLPKLSVGGLPFGIQLFHLEGRDGDLCAYAQWIDEHLSAESS